jgi:serine protease
VIGSWQTKSTYKKFRKAIRFMRPFRTRSFLSIVVLLICLCVLLGSGFLLFFYNSEKPVKINAGSFTTTIGRGEITRLFGNALASENATVVLSAKTPIEVKKEGSTRKAEFPFNALALAWEVDTPESTEVIFQIRVSKDEQNWSSWKTVEEDEDGNAKDDVTSAWSYGRLVLLEGTYIQQRTIFRASSLEEIPEVKRLKITYIDSEEKLSFFERKMRRIKLGVKKVFAAYGVPKRPTDKPSICSRKCWGADESIYVPGEDYASVKKVIVHHTVTSNSDSNPAATVRAIYYFHNRIRGWGDIGYNFLVGQKSGRIYEGRYGGDGVIGAHARGYNAGSVGVGVLGDFRYVGVNNKVRNALHKIVVWKFYNHKIDPDKSTSFGNPKRTLPSVFYHGQVGNTACAGTRLNNFVPAIKKMAHYMPQQIVLRNSSGTKVIVGDNSRTAGGLLRIYKSKGIAALNYVRKISAFPTDGTTLPNDPNYSSQWDIPKLDALKVWSQTDGGAPSIKVGVLDTGVAYEDYNPSGSQNYAKGPDFADTSFVQGYDYVNSDSHPNDDDGHGTAVASVIAESTNNSLGSASLAYNVSIIPIKVCDKDGWCLDSDVTKGIDFARNKGAKIINLSIEGDDYSSVIQTAINRAWDAGVIIAASSGNERSNKVSYPARSKHVIGVGALTNSDKRATYSNYGTGLDVMAPGGNAGGGSGDLLYQTVNCTAGLNCTSFVYKRIAGTSFATSLVAASAALIVSKGTLWPDSVARFLMLKAQDLGSSGRDKVYGWGRIRPYNSLQIATSEKPHPNGSLMRAIGKTTIYLIDSGQKRKIPSPAVFLSRYNPKLVVPVTSYEVSTYPSGSNVTFNDGVLLKGSSTGIYVLSNGKKRWIRSPKAFYSLGYKSENIVTVSDTTLSVYSNGPDVHSSTTHPDGSLIRARGATAIYLIDGGQKRKIPTPSVLISKFNRKYILETTGAKVASYPTGPSIVHNDSSILRAVGGTTIYVLSDGKKRRISHPITFSDLGYKSENITGVSAPYLGSFSNGDSVI